MLSCAVRGLGEVSLDRNGEPDQEHEGASRIGPRLPEQARYRLASTTWALDGGRRCFGAGVVVVVVVAVVIAVVVVVVVVVVAMAVVLLVLLLLVSRPLRMPWLEGGGGMLPLLLWLPLARRPPRIAFCTDFRGSLSGSNAVAQ